MSGKSFTDFAAMGLERHPLGAPLLGAVEPLVNAKEAQFPRVPLGNTTDFPSGADDQEVNPEATFSATCFQARSWGRTLLRDAGLVRTRASWCGARLTYKARSVPVYRRPDRPTARLGNLCQCGQTLVCPVCAPRVSYVRAAEVGTGWEKWNEAGGQAHMVTFTAPHRAGSPLLDEVDFWRDAWGSFGAAGGRSAAEIRKQRVGYMNALEMTHGANGWHVHRHLLMLHKGALDIEAHKRRWMDCLGSRYSFAAETHAFHSTPVDARQIAIYGQKIGAEIAGATVKDSKTPLRLLVDAAAKRSAAPEWIEAVKVVGARKLSICRWSPGLRDFLGMGVEKSDEEIAKDEVVKTDELLGVLTWSQWRKILARRLEYRVICEAQLGMEALDLFLVSHDLGHLHSDDDEYQAFLDSGDESETEQ